MTYPVRKSAKPALAAASGHPGVIYEYLLEDKYTPGHAWAAFWSDVVIGTIHYEGNHRWIVVIGKPSQGQLKKAYRRSFGTYTHALAALQEQLAKVKAPKGSSALLQ